MRYLTLATALLAVSACANHEPTTDYGRDGGRIGYTDITFDQAYAECQHSVNTWANTGFVDPLNKMLSESRQTLDFCLTSRGFAAQTAYSSPAS